MACRGRDEGGGRSQGERSATRGFGGDGRDTSRAILSDLRNSRRIEVAGSGRPRSAGTVVGGFLERTATGVICATGALRSTWKWRIDAVAQPAKRLILRERRREQSGPYVPHVLRLGSPNQKIAMDPFFPSVVSSSPLGLLA
jgi:hypothetical protein